MPVQSDRFFSTPLTLRFNRFWISVDSRQPCSRAVANDAAVQRALTPSDFACFSGVAASLTASPMTVPDYLFTYSAIFARLIRSYPKNVFWPNFFVGASFKILEIREYACGFKLGFASKLNQNPIFEIAYRKIIQDRMPCNDPIFCPALAVKPLTK
jgi:hypothetical protein